MAWGKKYNKDGQPQKPTIPAFDRGCALLGRREYSRHELIKALVLRDYPKEEAEEAVERLTASGFQSDQRFVSSLIRQKLDRGHGSQRLNHDIKQHKLDEELVAQEMEEQQPNWLEQARRIIERKYGSSPYDAAVRQKAFAFLMRRGFSMDVIGKALSRKDWDEN